MNKFIKALNAISHVRAVGHTTRKFRAVYNRAVSELPLGDRLLARLPYGVAGDEQLHVYAQLFARRDVAMAFDKHVDAVEALVAPLAPEGAPVASVIEYMRAMPRLYAKITTAPEGTRAEALETEVKTVVDRLLKTEDRAVH